MLNVQKKTRDMAIVGLLVSMYFTVTFVFSAISFGPLQFRIADIFQPFVLKGKKFIIAIALGTFLANIQSPFGVLDWGVMPIVSFIAGCVAYQINKKLNNKVAPFISMLVFAVIIASSVGYILYLGAGLPYWIGFSEVFITVGLFNMIGIFIVNALVAALKRRKLEL